MRLIPKHPFAMEALLERTLVLTYAFPREVLAPLVPAPLELDTFEERWGFGACALVDARSMRPKGFPAALGRDFVMAGYRIFVRYTRSDGRRLRGLYVLRSETNRAGLALFGGLTTSYGFVHRDLEMTAGPDRTTARSDEIEIVAHHAPQEDEIALDPDSPFASWKQARCFAGPMPFTFSVDARRREVTIVEGVRGPWRPRPAHVCEPRVDFFDRLTPESPALASAFVIEELPYWWKRGERDRWNA